MKIDVETIKYQHTDTLGNVVGESTASGTFTRYHYKPYGERVESSPERLGYTGHLNQKELALTYMQARHFDPVYGRMYGNDPIDFNGDPMTFNRYAYANNNPYSYVDPTGMFPFYTHMRLTYSAARQSGVGFWTSIRYAIQAGWADLRPGSQKATESAVAQHGMRVENQSLDSARANHAALIRREIARGGFGYAAHAVQDVFARGHKDFPFWDGEFFSRESFEHIWGDITATDEELDGAYNASVEMFGGVSGVQGSGGAIGPVWGMTKTGERTQLCGSAFVMGCNSASTPLPKKDDPTQQIVH